MKSEVFALKNEKSRPFFALQATFLQIPSLHPNRDSLPLIEASAPEMYSGVEDCKPAAKVAALQEYFHA